MNAHEPKHFGPFGGRFASVPPFPGKFRLINGAARLSCLFGSAIRDVYLWPHTQFTVDLRDRIQRQMWCGSYEPHVTRCLKTILDRGDTFLDIGAHIGYHSFLAAGLVGEQGTVYSFEPDPSVYARLKTNLQPFSQARALQCAVWDSDGEISFERSSCLEESGWGALTTVRKLGTGEEILVHTVSLDSWCEKTRVKAIRAIKVDAEGSELAFLRGARSTLERFRPVLLLEVNGLLLKQIEMKPGTLTEELLSLEYEIYELSFNRLKRLTSLGKDEFADCICLPQEQARALYQKLSAG